MLEHRDFAREMDPLRVDDPMFIPNHDFAVVPGDDGRYYRNHDEINSRTPASNRMQVQSLYTQSLKRELQKLEAQLDDEQYQNYTKIRNELGDDSEKIYYLRLKQSQKSEYLAIRNIEAPHYYNYTDQETKMAHWGREIVLGMSKNQVIQSWGRPDRKDFSGDSRYQNERWAYSQNGTVRYIYFQGGKVGGWTEQ